MSDVDMAAGSNPGGGASAARREDLFLGLIRGHGLHQKAALRVGLAPLKPKHSLLQIYYRVMQVPQ
jgi:hypothetical protein